MIDKAFVQTGVDGDWAECQDERLKYDELEKLTCAILLACDDDRGHRWFTLYHYRKNYSDDFPVGNSDENQKVFDGAREQADIVGFGHSFIRRFDWWKPQIIPMRWRIFQRSPAAPLYLAADVARVQQDRFGAQFYYETFSINVAMNRGISVISLTGYGSNRGAWTERTSVDVPANISDIAVEALRDSTKAWCGIRPTITWEQRGTQAILEYMAHPFDWNISALRSFIGEEAYQKLFPREQKDNFHPLCDYLGIHPTRSLRRAYAKNPYAIIWYVLLKGLGIGDLNIIQKFYEFDESIAGIPFCEAKFWKGKAVISGNNGAHIDWPSVEYYLKWVRKNKSQRAMENELYRLAKNGITQEVSDTLSQFARYEAALPKSLRRMLLKRGPTREVHDRTSEAVLEFDPNNRNTVISYSPEDQALEYRIGDYEFRLVKQTHELTVIGGAMCNCVASYRGAVLSKRSLILTARKGGRYAICIELDARHRLHQAYGPYNRWLSGDDLLACQKWIEVCHIEVVCGHLNDVNLSGADEWEIAQLSVEKLPSQMTVDELLAMSEEQISDRYYSCLAVAFEKSHPHRIAAPPWKTFATEREYLAYVFPAGQRIWEAAMDEDNLDAQYALGVCYAHGKVMPRDANRALAWLRHPAEEGLIRAQTLCQTIKCDNMRINGTYDERLREGLRLAKLRIQMQYELQLNAGAEPRDFSRERSARPTNK